VKSLQRTTRYFDCSECNRHRFTLDHLIDKEPGWTSRWLCDECGAAYAIAKPSVWPDFDIERMPVHDRPRRLVLLRLCGDVNVVETQGDQELYALAPVGVDPHDSAEDQLDHLRYYFEEHSCPTNFDYVSFILGGDPDPHGMWLVMGLMPMWQREGEGGDTHEYLRHIRDAAPELYEKHFKGTLHV